MEYMAQRQQQATSICCCNCICCASPAFPASRGSDTLRCTLVAN